MGIVEIITIAVSVLGAVQQYQAGKDAKKAAEREAEIRREALKNEGEADKLQTARQQQLYLNEERAKKATAVNQFIAGNGVTPQSTVVSQGTKNDATVQGSLLYSNALAELRQKNRDLGVEAVNAQESADKRNARNTQIGAVVGLAEDVAPTLSSYFTEPKDTSVPSFGTGFGGGDYEGSGYNGFQGTSLEAHPSGGVSAPYWKDVSYV